MSFLESALALARRGFHVFPLLAGTKDTPLITDFPNRATRDEGQIRRWWVCPVMGTEKPYNIGISTTKFKDDLALIAVDIDNKTEKPGYETLLMLENEGKEFPKTFAQKTPSTGRHLIYVAQAPVRQGRDVLGVGLDIRSKGGYLVGAGSKIPAGGYSVLDDSELAPAPLWITEQCGRAKEKEAQEIDVSQINEDRAKERALFYLLHEAPEAVEGGGGDQTTFQVAARLKDFGVTPQVALELLLSDWNDRCLPPWNASELKGKIDNAYRYGKEQVGSLAPEAVFEKLSDDGGPGEEDKPHPFDLLNREFAFVLTGGSHHILRETKDPDGKFLLEHIQENSFHRRFAADLMTTADGKTDATTRLWMKSQKRRTYDGICFQPGRPGPRGWYNLWRGFSVEPKPVPFKLDRGSEALAMFLEHAEKNVCRGDSALYRWLIGYFAHLVQKPWEKPLVAPVFRGEKGTGKNALVNLVGSLLESHYTVTSDSRYFLGNFNSHLENTLLFVLDEAFWSGNKSAEGTLKFLITEKKILIERKGQEAYKVDNCMRVVIIGNEHWIVPASHDERRFAVFDIGDGRKKDRKFFRTMREGMEAGGASYLLYHLQHFDLSNVDVDEAPETSGLLDQKIATLSSIERWWYENLVNGRIKGAGFNDWPVEMDKDDFRKALFHHLDERRESSWRPHESVIGKFMRNMAASVDGSKKKRVDDVTRHIYRFPDLFIARDDFDKYIGQKIEWPSED